MLKPTLLGLIIGISFLVSSCENANKGSLKHGLVSYYPFSGDARDYAGGNHGVVNGATLTTPIEL